MKRTPRLSLLVMAGYACVVVLNQEASAAGLFASDGNTGWLTGISAGASPSAGGMGLLGAPYANTTLSANSGAGYLFRNLDPATGNLTQDAKLSASDATLGIQLGWSAALSGNMAVLGAIQGLNTSSINAGAAYLFRNLDTASGNITQDAKLIASDGASGHMFGYGSALWGTSAVIGARFGTGIASSTGAAYLYRDLDTASGNVFQNAKLIASDGATNDGFGTAVGMHGTMAVVGAPSKNAAGPTSGRAYLFRNLNTATGTVTQNAILTASDLSTNWIFGYSISVSGDAALIGAYRANATASSAGAAYLYRNLSTANGTMTENAKLIASDGAATDDFGYSVALSGNFGIVGARWDDITYTNQGSAYLYRNLGTASGNVTESVKIWATDAFTENRFGVSVSLDEDGDLFVIGANRWPQLSGSPNSIGKGYTGSFRSLTVMDLGNAARSIDWLQFVSREDWVIGQNSSNNTVTLRATSAGNVTAPGMAIYVGRNAGDDHNGLIIEGSLTANTLIIGHGSNAGNYLTYNSTGSIVNTGSGPVGGNLTINAGGALIAGADHKLDDDYRVVLAGGTILTGNFDEDLGRLSLAGGGNSVISFNGTTAYWTFADSSMETWNGTLFIHNWDGTPVTGGGSEQLRFGSNNTTLSAAQLSQIFFVNPSSLPAGTYAAMWATLVPGEVVPVPEPAAWMLAAAGLGALAGRRRLSHDLR